MENLKKNQIVQLEIDSIALGGSGVAHQDGFTLFVKKGLPQQKVRARVTRIKKNYAEAVAIEIIDHSPFEINPQCSYFGVCGGCLFQNLSYEEQLVQKQRQVRETMEHIGGFSNFAVHSILPSQEIYFYRNKMEFSFSDKRWITDEEISSAQKIDRSFALGLHVPGSFDKVIDIDHCFLLSERSNQIISFVRDYGRASGLASSITRDHSGFWRFLVIRESKTLNQLMVNLVTAENENGRDIVKKLADELIEDFPFITTMVHNINRKKAQIAFGDEEIQLFGPGFIEEQLGTKKYRISANSFFQTNTLQAEKLYQLVTKLGSFSKDDVVFDLYSGTGSIAIFIADLVKQVVGFEIVADAITDAQKNCQLNNIQNCDFIAGELRYTINDPADLIQKYGKPSVVVIDPPRSGMHPKIPENIVALQPEKIIYVSCNPATLARDLKVLCEKHYQIHLIQPLDLFPQTAHCETVVLMNRV